MHSNNLTNPLFEGLEYKDLDGMMKSTIHVDEFASKMGDDADIIVLSFFVRDKTAARDLMAWFEKGYDFVVDADVSPGEIKPGRYLVYLENNVSSTNQASGYTSTETVTGTNIDTVTLVKDSDYYIVDNITITKTTQTTVTEDFQVRWQGLWTPQYTGTQYITAPADDGVRLYLDGELVIDDWVDKGGGGSTADVPTTAGVAKTFDMWYYENGGGANVALKRYTDNGTWEVIPASEFSTSTATATQIATLETATQTLNTEQATLTTLQQAETTAQAVVTDKTNVVAQQTLVVQTAQNDLQISNQVLQTSQQNLNIVTGKQIGRAHV